MNIVSYAVRYDKEGNIAITTFINGKLDRRDFFSKEQKLKFIQDCVNRGMTVRNGINQLKQRMDRIAEIQNKEERELEYLSKHYPDLFR